MFGGARALNNSLKLLRLKHKHRRCYVTCASSTHPVEVVGVEREKKEEGGRVLRVGLICGGPSAERGISLNSARSVLDHIQVL